MEPNQDTSKKYCPLAGDFAISDSTAAREISDMMLEFSTRLEQSVELVQNTCPLDEWKAYKKAAASIYVEMFIWVLEPLYKKHPNLKPPNWD